MSELLSFSAPVDLQAKAASGTATVSILAYSGGIMTVNGFGPVVIDLAGLQIPASFPLLSDHNADLPGVLGVATATIRNGELHAAGTISRNAPAAAQIIDLAKTGLQFQASVGIQPVNVVSVPEGESIAINGKTVIAPGGGMKHIRAGTLKEISVLALGADGSTAVTIAAKRHEGTERMSTEIPNAEPLELIRAKLVSKAITENPFAREDLELVEANAEAGNWSAQETELALVRASRPKTGGLGIVRRLNGSGAGLSQESISANLMIRAGLEKLAVESYGEKVVQAASELPVSSLVDVCRLCCQLEPQRAGSYSNSTDGIIRAAFSTTSLPNILSNTTGRALTAAYLAATNEILSVLTIRSAANFKAQKDIRPSAISNLEQLAPDGEIKHGSIGEEDNYSWNVDTYAKMLGVTRKDILDDNLGFLDNLPMLMSAAAARSLLDLVFKTLMGGEAANWFSTGNSNLYGAGSALSIATLGVAIQKLKDQRDSKGNNLSLTARALVVPTALEWTARAILRSGDIVTGSDVTAPSGNPLQGAVPTLIVAPQLSNSDKFPTGYSSTAYYLLAGPESSAVIIGFLNGRRTPTVEIDQADFSQLGIQMRVYHDYGVALGDEKGAVKATGAGS